MTRAAHRLSGDALPRGAMALGRKDLADAPLVSVLLRGLGLCNDDPLEGVLAALRSEVEVFARGAEHGGALDTANALNGIGRRLDVCVELRRRERSGKRVAR